MAEIIASGTTAADSADIVLTAGMSTTLYLKDAAGPGINTEALALIQIKSGTEYYTIGEMDWRTPALVLTAIGTFRVRRPVAAIAFGVDRD